jgi:hypothetical protein
MKLVLTAKLFVLIFEPRKEKIFPMFILCWLFLFSFLGISFSYHSYQILQVIDFFVCKINTHTHALKNDFSFCHRLLQNSRIFFFFFFKKHEKMISKDQIEISDIRFLESELSPIKSGINFCLAV